MKISYNWLKEYLPADVLSKYTVPDVALMLTDCGLEVESVEKHESIRGGLEGLVTGEIKTKEKHPDADRLSVTTVDIGQGTLLKIVCGAGNVAAGQKVVVATIGTVLYPTGGEPFEIKRSKIRGVVSEGMICAEDEIGLGTSHEGITVLDPAAKTGTPAKDYFKIESDFIFEIGLTPNRSDAASHIGVARDLLAVINCKLQTLNLKLLTPSINNFQVDNKDRQIKVTVEDTAACPRYSGISISGIEVKESPDWLKNRLKTIGLKPINNVVDATNYVLHELGQPLHAFDADKITGNTVVVKKIPAKTTFKTLDGIERELSGNDLMICNAAQGMCIAGVLGGAESGITEKTKNIFLESAFFDPVHIRKTAKYHGIKTDASFRYERGTDPNMTVYALKRSAMLIKEMTGGKISSDIIDIYPRPIENFNVAFSYTNCEKLIGKNIDHTVIKNILKSLDIEIVNEDNEGLSLSVPPYRVDVQREADIVEEILRIYGYNNIELPSSLRSSISFSQKPDVEKFQNAVSDLLSNNGFHEILTNSLSKEEYYSDSKDKVTILNPLSAELNVMRQSLMYSGLEAIAYNQNRKNADLKLYEFGKVYSSNSGSYSETKHLSLFICGRKYPEGWNTSDDPVSLYLMKSYIQSVLSVLGIPLAGTTENNRIVYSARKKTVVHITEVQKSVLKKFDIKQRVFYAEFNWDIVMELVKNNSLKYKEVPKFPEVRRDLALLIDKSVQYQQLEKLAFETEKILLKKVNLFDVYEGDKIEAGKKSYAMSFILQDENSTLTDSQTDKVMEKLINAYREKVGAVIR